MRVIVAGSTTWADEEAVRRELARLPAGTVIIHGDAPGADALGGKIARELGLPVEAMSKNKADYARYKRAAWKGLNERMLAAGATLVLAFHPAIEASTGTKHLRDLAVAHGIEAQVLVS